MSWMTLFQTADSTATGQAAYWSTWRIVIPASSISGSASSVRVFFQFFGGSTYQYTITDAYIGLRAISGDPYDIDPTTIARLTQVGSTTIVVSASSRHSDPVDLDLDGTRDVILSIYGGTRSYDVLAPIPSGIAVYVKTNTNVAGTADSYLFNSATASMPVFNGLEGAEPTNTGSLVPLVHAVVSSGESKFAIATITQASQHVSSSGESYFSFGDVDDFRTSVDATADSLVPLAGGSITFDQRQDVFATGISEYFIGRLESKLPAIALIGSTPVGGWGRFAPGRSAVVGNGIGNITSTISICPRPPIVGASAIVVSGSRGRVLSRVDVSGRAESSTVRLAGDGRVLSPAGEINSRGAISALASASVAQALPCVSGVARSANLCNIAMTPNTAKILGVSRQPIGVNLAFSRTLPLAPSLDTAHPFNILLFERS